MVTISFDENEVEYDVTDLTRLCWPMQQPYIKAREASSICGCTHCNTALHIAEEEPALYLCDKQKGDVL